MDAGLIFLVFYAWSIPLLSLLTMPKNDVIQGVSLLLGSIIGMFSGAQERKEMRTLKRAMEDCEYVEQMPRNRWAGVDRALAYCRCADGRGALRKRGIQQVRR